MAEEIVLSLKIDGADKAITSIDQLEREVAQLEETMRTADFGSQAFKDAEKELKEANAELYKFDRQLEAIQDPVAAQEKWVKYGEGVAGAFAAAQGAAAIFGVESENVEKMVVKAQGAVSIAMGARMLAESQLLTVISNSSIAQKALSAATAVSTTVFGASTTAVKLFRTALISTGIGAIAVAVGLLVANWDKLVAGFKNAADQLLNLVPGLSKVTGFFGKLIGKAKDLGQQLNLLPSDQEMANRKMAEQAQERLKQIDRESKQEIELVKAKGEDATELERKYLKERVDLTRDAFGEISTEYDDALHALDLFEAGQTKKLAEAEAERAAIRAQEEAERKRREEESQLIAQAGIVQTIQTAQITIDTQTQLDNKLLASAKKRQDGVINVEAEITKDRQEAVRLRTAAISQETDLASSIIGGLGNLITGEGKKATKARKAFAVAQIAIDTATGISNAVAAATQSAAATGPAAVFNLPIFLAAAIPLVLAQIAAARAALSQANVPGDTDGGGGAPPPPTISAPTFSAPTATGGGEAGGAEAAEQAFQTAGRAYVLDSDVSSGLEAQQRINDLASL